MRYIAPSAHVTVESLYQHLGRSERLAAALAHRYPLLTLVCIGLALARADQAGFRFLRLFDVNDYIKDLQSEARLIVELAQQSESRRLLLTTYRAAAIPMSPDDIYAWRRIDLLEQADLPGEVILL